MADKEATVFVVDVARSMGVRSSGREDSDLDWSLRYIWDKISTIVGTGRKTLLAGVVGMGTDKTNVGDDMKDDESYQHISILQPISQILLPDLQRLPRILKPSNTDNRDILSGIIVGLDAIMKHCKQLKYKKKLIVVTNGLGAMDDDDVEDTAEQLKKNDVELLLLGIDFDDPEYGFKEEDKSPEKAQNERTLRKLCDLCGGRYATMQEAIEGLAIPEVKQTRPTPTYKGYLRLGDNENYDTAVTIDVERYFRVSVRKAPTASSFAIKAQADGDDGLADVAHKYNYFVKDATRGDGQKNVEREDLAKGYEYGRTAVHISESDENITKLETFQSYDIMAFIPAEKLERYMIMDNTNMLVAPRGNDKAALALSSFIRALYELGSLAVARFVKKDGAEPALTLLSPHIEPDFECIIENILPFAEDARKYRFPPLDRVFKVSGEVVKEHYRLPKDDLLDAMSDFVDSMSLYQPGEAADGSDDIEHLPIEDTYSPVLHTIEGAIKYRAVHPDLPLPPKPELFASYSSQPAHLQSAAKPALDHLIKVANVKKIPPKQRGRRSKRESAKPIGDLDVDALFNTTNGHSSKKTISADNAIPEYKRAMDRAETEDQHRDLTQQMFSLVEHLVKKSFGDSNYARAVEMLGVVREELYENERAGMWREFLTGFRDKVKGGKLGGDREEFWWAVRKAKLGLIMKDEGRRRGEEDEEVRDGAEQGEADAFWSGRT
ncbi:ATP-dependent DNA helicase II subunit 2 [Cyphellophora attinorum]|uniref:ATP-dependent DNA helicase II subunit 2 n=1 Tax=Cyphellophora attinorum TaxID=1664694 RepID=A0A0N1NWA6_9EURO|nr:ATP-dependent DNA helicase II subunit 2 [Phialophora attinorum]KPI34965.1 ATP-dependent DNA helicase II subunit 2 [Phialophora attinorum]